jgi:PAS domain S-box-containing protein
MTGGQPEDRSRIALAGQILALAGVYAGLGKLGMGISPVGGFATLVWPPAGVALAALLLGGYRLWPGIALGALVLNSWLGASPLVACGIAAGNALEALLGALVLRRIPGFQSSLERFKDVIWLAVLAAGLSPVISATAGVTSLTLGGSLARADSARTWITWWTGDLVGILVIAPLLLTWATRPRPSPSSAKLAEAAAIGLVLITCAALVFGRGEEALVHNPMLHPYLLFIPLIWAALRFGVRGASTGMFVLAVIAVWGTYAGHGDFVRQDQAHSLVALHVFLGTTSLTTLALGAVVSERERSRLLLNESESLLRSIVDGTSDAVYAKDVLGRYVIMNAPGAHLVNLPSEAVVGKEDFALFTDEEARRLREMDQEVMRTGQALESEEHLAIGGQPRVYHTTKTPYRDRAGKLLGVIGISRDITERRRIEKELGRLEERKVVEKELRELEERQRLAVEAAHLGTWFWDIKADRLVWTPLCRSIYGIGPDEEITYERFLSAVHPDDRAEMTRAIQRAIEDHESYRQEHRAVWPDGSVHWISNLARVFSDETRAPERMLGVAFDITAQKLAEQEHVELLSRERAASAEALDAARSKDEFLAVVSHELRTPLQSMLGWAQVLREKRVDDRMMQRGLETIERNVKTQAQLIEDLLDISRVVSGKIRLDRRPIHLGPIVEVALAQAMLSADAKSIRLEASIDPSEGELLGDPGRLEQVVSNLLANAVKFTPNGGRVGVKLERDGATVRLVVEDNGRGISPEFLPYVFDRFRQADSTTTRSHGGLGIGLSIVHHLVALHGGTVKAESEGEDRGARFTVTLPLHVEARSAIAPKSQKSPAIQAATPTALDGVRVLMVDDDPDACELLTTVLLNAGAEVRAAHSAREALRELASFNPHLLLSDIGMPGEDGYALLRQVRAREATEGGHVPAVALTAFASRADREEALSLGFEEHLAKPVSPADLMRTVARVVGRAP